MIICVNASGTAIFSVYDFDCYSYPLRGTCFQEGGVACRVVDLDWGGFWMVFNSILLLLSYVLCGVNFCYLCFVFCAMHKYIKKKKIAEKKKIAGND